MHTILPICDIPTELYAGDSLALRFASASFPRSEDWDLEFVLVGPEKIEVAGTADPDNADAFLIEIGSSDSSGWLPGRYAWTVLVTDADDERHTAQRGALRILPDPTTQDGSTEQRSFARQALDAIEAILLEKGGELGFSVFGRSYQFESREALIKSREYFRREVEAETEAERRAQGKPSRRVAWFRF